MNNLSVKSRYRVLCKLHSRYKSCVKFVLENVYEDFASECRIIEIEKVLNEIEKFPIPWEFYNAQRFKFLPEFEELVVFTNE